MNFLQGIVSETNGTPSSLRISFLVWEIILVCAFGVLIGYTVYSHYHNPETPFNPSSALTWVASIFAANRGSKLIQKPFESDSVSDFEENQEPTHPIQAKDL